MVHEHINEDIHAKDPGLVCFVRHFHYFIDIAAISYSTTGVCALSSGNPLRSAELVQEQCEWVN